MRDDDLVLITVQGESLAPQDYDVLLLFRDMYCLGSSFIHYDGLSSLKMLMSVTKLNDPAIGNNVWALLAELYNDVNRRKSDYSSRDRNTYFGEKFTIEKNYAEKATIPEVYKDIFKGMTYERAPDVYVKPY